MQSYDYAHRQGIEPISWERFGQLGARLAEQVAAAGSIDAVVGIARAGLFPGAAVACMLRTMLYPVSLSRRVNDEVKFQQPQWRVDVSPEVAGKTIAVIDEIADTGQTLALVADRARQLGAARVVTAVLVRHTWADPPPDCAALVTDALVIFPWDREVYEKGAWRVHPELEEAIRRQGRDKV